MSTIYECKKCDEENPCILDTITDELRPTNCPLIGGVADWKSGDKPSEMIQAQVDIAENEAQIEAQLALIGANNKAIQKIQSHTEAGNTAICNAELATRIGECMVDQQTLTKELKRMHLRIGENEKSIGNIGADLNEHKETPHIKSNNGWYSCYTVGKEAEESNVPTEEGYYWYAGEVVEVCDYGDDCTALVFRRFTNVPLEDVIDDGKWGKRINE